MKTSTIGKAMVGAGAAGGAAATQLEGGVQLAVGIISALSALIPLATKLVKAITKAIREAKQPEPKRWESDAGMERGKGGNGKPLRTIMLMLLLFVLTGYGCQSIGPFIRDAGPTACDAGVTCFEPGADSLKAGFLAQFDRDPVTGEFKEVSVDTTSLVPTIGCGNQETGGKLYTFGIDFTPENGIWWKDFYVWERTGYVRRTPDGTYKQYEFEKDGKTKAVRELSESEIARIAAHSEAVGPTDMLKAYFEAKKHAPPQRE
jgi:hypothetical protein